MQLTIDMDRIKRFSTIAAATALCVTLTACGGKDGKETEPSPVSNIELNRTLVVVLEEPASTEKPWTDEEIEAMALTLAGECYEDKKQDKRRVCEVILNRVSSDEFDDTILGVITKSSQFHGYWEQSRPVSDNDRTVAEQALKDWYDIGCAPLSEYLYFEAGDNRENEFRKEFSK